jgi:hypothetical protein
LDGLSRVGRTGEEEFKGHLILPRIEHQLVVRPSRNVVRIPSRSPTPTLNP